MLPVEPASYVIMLADATGWDEQYILDALPLARGNQYIHAILVSKGARTMPTSAALKKLVEGINHG